jgi:hypothetical protein
LKTDRLSGPKGDLSPTDKQSVSPCWCNNVIHLLQKKNKTKSDFLVRKAKGVGEPDAEAGI